MGNIGTCSIVGLHKEFRKYHKTILKVNWKDDLSNVIEEASKFTWILPPYKVEDTFASSQVIVHLGNQLAAAEAKTKLLIPLCGLSRQYKSEWVRRYKDNDMYFPQSKLKPIETATFCRELMWEGTKFENKYVVHAVHGNGVYPFDYYMVVA